MGENKFRAWNTDNDRYEYSGSVQFDGVIVAIWGKDKYDWILEQYTGFTDKLGKEIYEGDIVLSKGLSNRNSWDAYSHKGMENNNIRIVTWVDNGWGIVDFKLGRVTAGIGLKTATQKRFEVIGNIHENENLIS